MKALLLVLSLWLAQGLAQKAGDPVALPRVQDSYNKPVDLPALARDGRYMVFWFYPQGQFAGLYGPGKRYAELYDEFRKRGVEVFGVSADPAAEQCEFIENLALKGGMLPDKSGTLAKLFGVGGIFGLYNRDTILVNPQGRIEQIWRGVNPFRDADTVLAYIKEKTGR